MSQRGLRLAAEGRRRNSKPRSGGHELAPTSGESDVSVRARRGHEIQLASVIVVCWNAQDVLERCLEVRVLCISA